MKKVLAISAAAVIALNLALPVSAEQGQEEAGKKDIVILYTNDVHCGIDDHIGYDGLALYKREMQAEHENVLLVDAGDSLQGALLGTLSDGKYITELMNKVGYDAATIGNHDFDYGVPVLQQRAQELSCGYICCNFKDKYTGQTIYDPYKIFECGDTKIAFVGVDTPETFSKSTPTYFQNEQGEYIYSFAEKGTELYDVVQDNVDKARSEGADYVILLAHLGENDVTESWSAPTVAANTSGIDAVIDGHSHEVTPSLKVKNKLGEEVTITQTGTKLANIGKMTITDDGLTTELLSEVPAPADSIPADTYTVVSGRDGIDRYADTETNARINAIMEEVAILDRKIGETPFKLYDSDPETGERRVRNGETNLGNLCTDAMREVFDTDVAILNGGGIRSSIESGDIHRFDLLNVHPYGNTICAAKVTGQQIYDYIERGAKNYPEENGSFPNVSGIEFTIDLSVASTVTENEYGEFTGITGEYRVKKVLINGEPLDPDKTYTIASISYLLKEGGDGMIFSGNCEVYKDDGDVDVDVLENYIRDILGGTIPDRYKDPYGEGRIKVTDGKDQDDDDDNEDPVPDPKPDDPFRYQYPVYIDHVAVTRDVVGSGTAQAGTAGPSAQASDSADPPAAAPPAADDQGGSDNPDTGAAAVSSVIIISLAAVVVSRKKH